MIDRNGIAARARRLKALREVQGGALPGQSLVVSEPTPGLVRDVFPCADGQAQERSRLGQVRETGQAGDRWMHDRQCCPWALLCASDTRGAGGITRPQEGRPWETVHGLRSVGRIETGHVAEQRVHVRDAQGGTHLLRRLRVQLEQATRDGARGLDLLTTLPLRRASATRVARRYRTRWTLETAGQPLDASCHAAMQTVGYPQAAVCGLCLALVAYNL